MNDAETQLGAVERVYSDSDLKAALQNATQKRVDPKILSAAGLFSVRILAAMVLARADTNEDRSAADALGQVLAAITERIGNRKGTWLNALSMVGQRIAGYLCSGYSSEVYRPQSATGPTSSAKKARSERKKVPPALAATISEIKQADGAKVLSPAVLKDRVGLERLLARDANAVAVMDDRGASVRPNRHNLKEAKAVMLVRAKDADFAFLNADQSKHGLVPSASARQSSRLVEDRVVQTRWRRVRPRSKTTI
jgi:hypothetical protein